MEIPKEVQDRIDLLMKSYNVVIKDIKDLNKLNEPTLYDMLMQFVFPNFDAFEDYPPEAVIVALVELTCLINDSSEAEMNTLKDKAFIRLNVQSSKVYIENIVDHMMYILTEEDTEDSETEEYNRSEFVLEEARTLINAYNKRIVNIPKKHPFKPLRELFNKSDINIELMNTVNEIAFELVDTKHKDSLKYIYSLLRICPYAFTSMSIFLSEQLEEKDIISLLELMADGYRVTHPLTEDTDIYEFEDYKEYLMTLDSLGYLYKMMMKTDKAITNYELLLNYDQKEEFFTLENLILPYMNNGDIEKVDQIFDLLDDTSVHKTYFMLISALEAKQPFHTEYVKAFDASPNLMKMICEEDNKIYLDLNQKERMFAQDFYPLFEMSKATKTLIDLYNED